MNNTLKNRIIIYFENEKFISRKELFKAISNDYLNLKESTINVYITKLKKEGILKNPSRGVYSLDKNEIFNPNLDRSLKIFYNKIHKVVD